MGKLAVAGENLKSTDDSPDLGTFSIAFSGAQHLLPSQASIYFENVDFEYFRSSAESKVYGNIINVIGLKIIFNKLENCGYISIFPIFSQLNRFFFLFLLFIFILLLPRVEGAGIKQEN